MFRPFQSKCHPLRLLLWQWDYWLNNITDRLSLLKAVLHKTCTMASCTIRLINSPLVLMGVLFFFGGLVLIPRLHSRRAIKMFFIQPHCLAGSQKCLQLMPEFTRRNSCGNQEKEHFVPMAKEFLIIPCSILCLLPLISGFSTPY